MLQLFIRPAVRRQQLSIVTCYTYAIDGTMTADTRPTRRDKGPRQVAKKGVVWGESMDIIITTRYEEFAGPGL